MSATTSMLPHLPLIARGLASATESPKGAEMPSSSAAAGEEPEQATNPSSEEAGPSAGPGLEERSVEELQALIGEKNETIGEFKTQVRPRVNTGVMNLG